MAFFKVTAAVKGGKTAVNGIKQYIVECDSAAIAKELVIAQESADSTWSDSTAADVTTLSGTDYEGWKYTVAVTNVGTAEYTGIASDTINDIGDALVIAANLLAGVSGSAYATPLFTFSSIGDGFGDETLSLTITPPDVDGNTGNGTVTTGMVGAIVHEGIAGAVLTVVLTAQTAIPTIVGSA